ncbi:MAG: type I 3-dehydroquinate dehydratase [Clostridium sp.]|jgi:3-dehydroquinate dehydratase type I|uniref:type I 3-dehydroquinate dehydratase n=1 Tax=Clostridium sp. TaxID=1506 RepID=UPI0025C57605|nr:type I 3-dehydroquinate dehydratase [Clostridium sp.]MCH3963073.1 type I 3-dehydroquinate dehydratase [Clostridium sp.]MCI1716464.1 type I 3-dehydroquinate dehydratase [Clostridium sp.]MCI1800804.1 type I 3-dehydroquinate dehydratase [Clostridium sp.]MCI1814541.1 type I 3-dehydroquinate dehydratase [Clostridium sp.]MCI1871451.1 type I 3-dehydroquinate dehydratase [Clostridium sp.]
MNKIINVRNTIIGEGMPKICVPMVGKSVNELMNEAELLKSIDFDIIEWRVDFFESVKKINEVEGTLRKIRDILPEIPMIFTFRSIDEGGQIEASKEFYVELNEKIIRTGLVDIIDIELFNDEDDIRKLIHTAHMNSVFVIISNHDLKKTPSKEEIIYRLCREQKLGGDIIKIAVMPNCTRDIINLLDASQIVKEKYARAPVVTMSMGGKGVITRLSGEIFGSDITFAAVKKASAPGQIYIEDVRKTIQLLHNNLN